MRGPDLGAQGLAHFPTEEAVGLEDSPKARKIRRLAVEGETWSLADLGLGCQIVAFRRRGWEL
jgi:hypothetical protein